MQEAKDSYRRLSTGWKLYNNNKGKSKEFALDSRRRGVNIIVYPNGSVLVNIKCSTRPFKIHEPSGLVEFFACLGEIRSILIGELQNYFSVIPAVDEWWLTQYDLDSAITSKSLKGQSSILNISTSLRNAVQIKWLGHLFYFYIKNMPDVGQVCRFEERKFQRKNL